MNRRAFGLASLAALSGCAPAVLRPMVPSTDFAGPRLGADALISFDGARLPMTVWPATDGLGDPAEPWAVVLALHGMDDYAGGWVEAGPYWAARGITVYAYDQRGHGRGDGRGVWGGEASMDQDLRVACALLRACHPKAMLAVVGESMGGAVAITAFASPTPPDADRLVLLSPAVWGWSEQPITSSLALWLVAHTDPGLVLTPPDWVFRKYQPSDNIDRLRAMGRDRNMIFRTRTDAAYGLVNLMQDASAAIGRVRAPTLYCYGQHDNLIPKRAAFHAAARLGPNGRTAYYRDGWHLLNRDLHNEFVLEDVAAFIRDPKAPLPSGAPPMPPPKRHAYPQL